MPFYLSCQAFIQHSLIITEVIDVFCPVFSWAGCPSCLARSWAVHGQRGSRRDRTLPSSRPRCLVLVWQPSIRRRSAAGLCGVLPGVLLRSWPGCMRPWLASSPRGVSCTGGLPPVGTVRDMPVPRYSLVWGVWHGMGGDGRLPSGRRRPPDGVGRWRFGCARGPACDRTW
jgi:hypothetical protein